MFARVIKKQLPNMIGK